MDSACLHHELARIELRQPFYQYFELFKDSPYAFLLDSAKEDHAMGQNSYLGGDPFMVYEASRIKPTDSKPSLANISVTRFLDETGNRLNPPQMEERIAADLFSDLRNTFTAYRLPRYDCAEAPTPFLGGLVGYLGYEVAYLIESLPDLGVDDLDLKDVCFMFCDSVLCKNHQNDSTWISVIGRGPSAEKAAKAAKTTKSDLMRRIHEFERRPSAVWRGLQAGQTPKALEFHKLFSKESYCDAVRTAKSHIESGDLLEVCLSQRMDAAFSGETWNLYRELRRISPAPYAAFLKMPTATVLCSSPERFIKLDLEGGAESRPIKGTRPRGQSPIEDASIREDLQTSPKDRAENMMIVDLVRNDLGRVSEFGTVRVPELMVVEAYATLFQLVSTVTSKLRADADVFDLLRAMLPGGSMTGAPKIAAMKIIDTLEPVKRGIYSGGIGFIDFSGTADLNIVIRSFVIKEGRVYLNVGGAIVADSDPHAEYQETMDKAQALITALENLNGCGLA
jgi:para-aminobenzoate synthetase component 1